MQVVERFVSPKDGVTMRSCMDTGQRNAHVVTVALWGEFPGREFGTVFIHYCCELDHMSAINAVVSSFIERAAKRRRPSPRVEEVARKGTLIAEARIDCFLGRGEHVRKPGFRPWQVSVGAKHDTELVSWPRPLGRRYPPSEE